MIDLSTTYMGLKLKNPLLAASCSLSKNLEGVKKLAAAGLGGIVLKSLFEEQLEENVNQLKPYLWLSGHAEAFEYVKNIQQEVVPESYLKLIESAKKSVDVPIIASLNCVTPGWWINYARKLADAGADGLELNISPLAFDPERSAADVEKIYYQIVEDTRRALKIPIAVKLPASFTSFAHLARQLQFRGANALVIFNRFFQFDFDLDKIEVKPAPFFSTSNETYLPLRWISLLSGVVECDLAATTGIHTAEDVIKHILAGARAVQICSVLYQKKLTVVREILEGIQNWMEKHNFSRLDDFCGRLSRQKSSQPEVYQRLQYIKNLVGIE